MYNRKRKVIMLLAICFASVSIHFGCASSATAEQLRMLEDSQSEVVRLEQLKMVQQLMRDSLAASIAAKESELKDITLRKAELLKR